MRGMRALAVAAVVAAAAAGRNREAVALSRNASLTATSKLEAPRLIAYVNCVCGFGFHRMRHDAWTDDLCGNDPDPEKNYMLELELNQKSPITHYILSFLSFTSEHKIQTDQGAIWENGGGSTSDFQLAGKLLAAMAAAQKNGKKVMVSIGGETGSSQFLEYWRSKGENSEQRVAAMRSDIMHAIAEIESQNNVGPIHIDGVDIDIELGGGYPQYGEKYNATRDLIMAVPDSLLTAFVPQVGNGLCAAPTLSDVSSGGYNPVDTLGGQCMSPAKDGSPWSLAKLAIETKKSDGSMKLDWLGIQYYNAVTAVCCGGGTTESDSGRSTAQNYKNLALGWEAVPEQEMMDPNSPWYAWRWWPGAWDGFEGIGSDRLVLGKPACHGCAGSNFIDMTTFDHMLQSIGRELQGHPEVFGGVLLWDLCRMFGSSGKFCVGDQCQPALGGSDVGNDLNELYSAMKRWA